jgi:DUF4097 and DUF4098 domain-containing protein YvlB
MNAIRISLLTFAAASVLFTGCEVDLDLDGMGPSDRYKEDFRYEYAFKPGSRLEVETRNGSVNVTTWDQDKIEITGSKYAGKEEVFKALKIDVVNSESSVRIKTVASDGVNSNLKGNWGARYVIRVPKGWVAENLKSTNGAINIEGANGAARVDTSNGKVGVRAHRGDLNVGTSNGSIDLRDIVGKMRLDTSNGSISITQAEGELWADTSNASIDADLKRATPNSRIHLDSSNGSIRLRLQEHLGNPVFADTSNSSITLELPGTINARLLATTSNSSITNDFSSGGQVVKVTKTHHEMTIGSGGPLVEADTSNGSIRIIKQ